MKSLLDHFLGEVEEVNPMQSLAMDIEDLLNHTRSAQQWHKEDGPSLFNYGVPTWVGKPMSAKVLKNLADEIKQALMLFEPRFEPSSIHVWPVEDVPISLGVYQLEIQAQLREKISQFTEREKIEWFVHIDPHYGQAKISEKAMHARLLK